MSPTIPYSRQWIEEADIEAVIEALRSDWLTTGPRVDNFESAFAAATGVRRAVAVSSGTAALHAAVHALGIGPGDEVIVPALTFVATANVVVFQGGLPVFADVHPDTLLVDPEDVARKISPRTRAIIAVDYAGQPADYDALRRLAEPRGLPLIADACHAVGAADRERPVGTLADVTVFSFHPAKHITTGEGGMCTTASDDLADRMRRFRNHGLDSDARSRAAAGTWKYEMVDLGFNYRISDFQCALGLRQLKTLGERIRRRREIARHYDAAFSETAEISPLASRTDVHHAWHLYVIRLALDRLRAGRAEIYSALRKLGIGVNVHYLPVHLHPYYRERFGTGPGLCPAAEAAYERILTLPLFPTMTREEVDSVVRAVHDTCRRYATAPPGR